MLARQHHSRSDSPEPVALFRIRAARDRIRLQGHDCLDFLQRMSTADLRALEPNAGTATVFVTEKGRILDVACLLRTGVEEAELLLSPGAGELIWRWLRQHRFTEELELAPPERWTGVELHGIRSVQELSALLGKELHLPQRLAWGDWATVELEGIPVRAVAVPGLRAHGVALLAEESAYEGLERQLAGIPTVDESTAEALRILAGIGRWGAEWRQEYNPFEAGLEKLVSLDKGCYVGQEVLARLQTYGKVQRRLVRVCAQEPLHPGMQVLCGELSAGELTSTAYASWLQQWVALGYVRRECLGQGVPLFVQTPVGEKLALELCFAANPGG